jgi:hypothetical protein
MHAVRETHAVRRSAEPNILLHTRDATDALPQTAGVVPLPPVASGCSASAKGWLRRARLGCDAAHRRRLEARIVGCH